MSRRLFNILITAIDDSYKYLMRFNNKSINMNDEEFYIYDGASVRLVKDL